MLFRDRSHAGQELAGKLSRYADRGVLVLALPRGGVVVGFEIAKALTGELDIFLVRKLGVPGQRELALGALASGGVCVLNNHLIDALQIPAAVIERIVAVERRELERREAIYRGGRPAPIVAGRTVILVDDGIATGSTMRAAARALRQQAPQRLVIATPVAPASAVEELAVEADELVCVATPGPFFAISQWYGDFTQTTDEQVYELLDGAPHLPVSGGRAIKAA